MVDIFNIATVQQIEYIKTIKQNQKIGFTCSCFDLLHPGHVLMLKDAKTKCDILVVGLQTDPTLDRPQKNKPIQAYGERKIMIESIKYIDYVIDYATENDLFQILKELNPDIRILGSDWIGKLFTGHELPIPIYFHMRKHNYSTSNLRKKIFNVEITKQSLNSPIISRLFCDV